MAAPGARNLEIVHGDSYPHRVSFVDAGGAAIDVSGRTYIAQIRSNPTSSAADAEFTVDTSGAATGVIVLHLTATQTAALAPGVYRWDLQEDSAGELTTILAGTVSVLQDVSR